MNATRRTRVAPPGRTIPAVCRLRLPAYAVPALIAAGWFDYRLVAVVDGLATIDVPYDEAACPADDVRWSAEHVTGEPVALLDRPADVMARLEADGFVRLVDPAEPSDLRERAWHRVSQPTVAEGLALMAWLTGRPSAVPAHIGHRGRR